MMRTKTFHVASFLFSVAVAAAGCGGSKNEGEPSGGTTQPQQPGQTAAGTKEPVKGQTPAPGGGTGTITGTITFEGAAPAMPQQDRKSDPVCAKMPTKANFVGVGAGGGLQDVLVRLPVGAAKGDAPSAPVVIDQKGCMYQPYVSGLVEGQQIAFRNSDPTMHNVHPYADDRSMYNAAMTAGSKDIVKDVEEEAGAVVKLKCDAHGWMEGWVLVSDHPYFNVTNNEGKFTISNVPAGEYELEAWHPHLGMRKAKVTVKANETATASFDAFTPADYKAPK